MRSPPRTTSNGTGCRGHSGVAGNERADRLANQAIDAAGPVRLARPMRQIVLDTETTGLEPELGHRIIEIGCVELVNRRPTGPHLPPLSQSRARHRPGRARGARHLARGPAEQAALRGRRRGVAGVHRRRRARDPQRGVRRRVPRCGAERVACGGARRATSPSLCRVLDTLALAREMHPGPAQQPGRAVQALRGRQLAPRAARRAARRAILADVYLAMTGGQVAWRSGTVGRGSRLGGRRGQVRALVRPAVPLRVIMATAEELARTMPCWRSSPRRAGASACGRRCPNGCGSRSSA